MTQRGPLNVSLNGYVQASDVSDKGTRRQVFISCLASEGAHETLVAAFRRPLVKHALEMNGYALLAAKRRL